MDADRLLVATGRRADTEGLGLEEAGIDTEAGYVRTNRWLATSVRGIWAAGDVTGKLHFTHAADEMGRLAARNALSKLPGRPYRPALTPWVTFTDPEVGRVGLTEAQAASRGARVAYLPMTEVDRAIAAGRTEGYVKLVVGPRRGPRVPRRWPTPRRFGGRAEGG